MRAAATAEPASEHPLAGAVLTKARAEGVSPGRADDFTSVGNLHCASEGRGPQNRLSLRTTSASPFPGSTSVPSSSLRDAR